MTTPGEDRLLTPGDMADRFDVPVSTVMQWNRAKKWPHVRVGKRVRWTHDQLEEILRRQTVTPENTTMPGQTQRSAARKKAS